ncbi:MAG TPA: hypothetical protein VGF01_12435, partial [Terracidiphilus sp.]
MNLIRAMRVVATCWSRRLEVIRFGLAHLRKYYPRLKRNFPVNIFLTMIFTMLAMAVMGYHPGLEDDGIYLSAIKKRLNPPLYPHDADFFRFQLQATIFDNWMAGFVRWTHIPLAWAELYWQAASITLILYGCWRIARRLFPEARAQWAGVAMTAAMLTLPVAGTDLYLVDQHLHPRTMATAFILLGIERVLARRNGQTALLLMLAFLLHPIMAALGVSFCIFLCVALRETMPLWLRGWEREAGGGVIVAAFIPLGWVFDPPNPLWRESVRMHSALCLYNWAWYEWLGAIAPLLLFWLLSRLARRQGDQLRRRFALAVAAYGAFHLALAMILLAIPSLIRVAPFQPMRFLHLVYFFMTLLGGCLLGQYLLQASLWRWALFLAAINGGMFLSQWMLFNSSYHLELPGRPTANPWLQAFDWVRENTPKDAYFALDPEYMAAPREDYHCFRALAERGMLADNIKDPAVVTQ